jgi:hypothetical protein
MGADYTSYAIIGFEIDVEMLYITKRGRSCSCLVEFEANFPPKFCTECGGAFMGESQFPIDGYDEDDKLKDMTIIFGTDRETAYIGTEVAKESDYSNSQSFKEIETDVETMKWKIKEALGEELFEAVVYEETFGLHSVLQCSY